MQIISAQQPTCTKYPPICVGGDVAVGRGKALRERHRRSVGRGAAALAEVDGRPGSGGREALGSEEQKVQYCACLARKNSAHTGHIL